MRRLEDGEVEVSVAGACERVSSEASEVLRARNAGGGAAVARRVERTGHTEGREVQKELWRVRARERIADEVGAREELARAVVVVEEVDVERAARSECEDAAQLPALAEPRQTLEEAGDRIAEGGDEALARVEVGVGALQVCAEAVVGLRGVGDVVLSVRGVVNRVRPGVVRARRPAAALAQSQARLQRVVA